MRNFPSRRGSALLIVLGMLSFMIVSAVGFAAYMRYARLPSSYLRRTSASRMLAKAAVAQAVDSIDLAVNNNPHPGVGIKWVSNDRQASGDDRNRNRNVWASRVLFGTNYVAGVNVNGSDDSWQQSALNTLKAIQESANTPTPLCLEALAYIPPPLVNEARAWSKLTPTAQWQSFGFDVGRFCFVALDVSDYFDINRLSADLPRSSSPASRISLAYLFENGLEHTSAGNGAAQWDQFMEQFRTLNEDTLQVEFNGKFPLISLADFNLALGQKGKVGGFNSPFYDYIKRGGSGAGFYGTESEEDEERIRRMTFVTDGLFPSDREDDVASSGTSGSSSKQDDLIDLNDGRNQPFPKSALATRGGRRPTLSDTLMGGKMNDAEEWRKHIGRVGCAALFDYLDTDHLPLSLALPVTERVPMICGISPKFVGSKFGVEKKFDPEGENDVKELDGDGKTWRVVEKTVSYKINGGAFVPGFMGGKIEALTVFPFSHEDDTDLNAYTVDGRFSFFFSTVEMPLRTSNPNDALHLESADIGQTAISPDGVMNVHLAEGGQALPQFTDITTPESAVKKLDGLRLDGGQRFAMDFARDGNDLLKVTYKWRQTRNTNAGGVGALGGDWEPKFAEVLANPNLAQEIAASTAFKALKADGTVDDAFANGLVNMIKGGGEKDVWLNAAVWLLVKNGSDVVDMVPACFFDDKYMNNVPDAAQIYTGLGPRFGMAGPLFRFDTGVKFKFSIAGLDALSAAPQDVKLTPEAAIVADPRFNYAPESWFTVAGTLDPNSWVQNNHANDPGCDGDIFMATSDAGYMQSKYELAMLPRFTPLRTFGSDATIGDLESPVNYNENTIPANFGRAVNSKYMWRTYDPFEEEEVAFDELPWTSEGTGFKVNPYSDNKNVLLAALANTPMDWKRASTNVVQGAEDFSSLSSAEFNKKYAWNSYTQSKSSKISWTVLEKIADEYRSLVKANSIDKPNADWIDAWQEMDWFGDKNTFCGVRLDGDTDSIWMADRKFFYGYWRDCFAAKQQLYMVFVRAEPMMMGGDTGALAPPQLSTRAMALVWRDPSKSREAKLPHQTRVLFYRQFE